MLHRICQTGGCLPCSPPTLPLPARLCAMRCCVCDCVAAVVAPPPSPRRVNFLLDAIGGTAEDLLAFPGYALLSLPDVVGPRYYFLARHPGWLDAFSDPSTGSLQLQRVMQPALEDFLADVARVCVGDSLLCVLTVRGLTAPSPATKAQRLSSNCRTGASSVPEKPCSCSEPLADSASAPLPAARACFACIQVTGVSQRQVEAEYAEMNVEWQNLLGWCAEKAFSNLEQVSSMYQEQVNLFYVLVQ